MAKVKHSVVKASFDKLVNETPARRATIKRAGGYDPAKGPKHPDNQDPTLPIRCDYRDAHDPVTDQPMGKRCESDATHMIKWEDGRYSYGCGQHLEIEDSATVKPVSILSLTRSAGANCITLSERELDVLLTVADVEAKIYGRGRVLVDTSVDWKRLVELGVIDGGSPQRLTARGMAEARSWVIRRVGDAHAAMRKANTRLQKCSKPTSLDEARRAAKLAEGEYRDVAKLRDWIVEAIKNGRK
jgi:hypothetical protein